MEMLNYLGSRLCLLQHSRRRYLALCLHGGGKGVAAGGDIQGYK